MKTLMISFIFLAAAVNLAATKPGSKLKLTILYDNYQFDKAFMNSWGFSCLIEGLDKTILFDCGVPDSPGYRSRRDHPGCLDYRRDGTRDHRAITGP